MDVKVSEDDMNYASVNSDGALLVEGIEEWIVNLLPVGHKGEQVMMTDSKTGATFLIGRMK